MTLRIAIVSTGIAASAMTKGLFLLLILSGQIGGALTAAEAFRPAKSARIDTFNYALGTQTIGASYQFTQESRLVETALAILNMGSNAIKFAMGRDNAGKDSPIRSLAGLAADESSFKTVFDMPFAYYVIWTYPFGSGSWHGGFSKDNQEKEYKEMYEFVSYLLKTYDGTGKAFYLGHWEGDWALRGIGNTKDEEKITPQAIQGMVDWLNVRQRAIDDAKRMTPHRNVQVWHYTEVNRVDLSMKGLKTVANDVIPETNVDYVSYSCYDSQRNPAKLKAAMDYVENKLPAKPGITGKRIFIGEYGFDTCHLTPEQQETMSRQVMRAALEWGCPFALYWEMYNNEIDKDGKQRGFWLIDDRNKKQPVYYTHQKFYQRAKQYVADFVKEFHRPPTFDEFRKEAVTWLSQPAKLP